ncbi:MAG: BON domain-containing protein [Methylobacter sp.]
MKTRYLGILALVILSPGIAAGVNDNVEQTSDIWIKAKIMTTYALNEYLSPYAIAVHVNRGTVKITGMVASHIESDLAKTIAQGVQGVEKIDNQLHIDAGTQPNSSQSSFLHFVEDANTAAKIKSKQQSPAPKIRATSKNGVVFLEG